METPIGLNHLDQWGFKNWRTDKFKDEIVLRPLDWLREAEKVDRIILVDDQQFIIDNKAKLARFYHKLISIQVPNFDDDGTTKALQDTAVRIIAAVASCKNK